MIYTNRVLADGSVVPFEIPDKRTFVITRWSFSFDGAVGVSSSHASLLALGGFALTSVFFEFNGSGEGGATVELEIPVAAGSTLCGLQTDGLASIEALQGTLYGYLTKAK